MATMIRPELSEKNKYWVSKHRYYELKYFCLQYPTWKRVCANLDESGISMPILDHAPSGNAISDITSRLAIKKSYYSERIDLIEKTAKEADDLLYTYIIKAVTEGLSFTYLKSILEIPCSRDTYYDRYRKFFWLLDRLKS